MSETQIINNNHLQAILIEQARIALVNYDAAMKNQSSLCKLSEMVAEQSKQVAILLATVADLLESFEQSKKSRY